MPRFGCPFCSAWTDLPDDWPHPGFTCAVCYRPVPFQPRGTATVSTPTTPQFLPVGPRKRWGWTPWFVVLLGAAVIGSVFTYLATDDEMWLMALGAPAVALLVILALVWTFPRGHSDDGDGGEPWPSPEDKP